MEGGKNAMKACREQMAAMAKAEIKESEVHRAIWKRVQAKLQEDA